MSEYTSTREGFQRAMEETLTGPPDEAVKYRDKTTLPSFYQIINGKRLERDVWTEHLADWRGKISEYKPVVHEFLRSGDDLAARMDGTIKVDGVDTYFESFFFIKVDNETGKMLHMIERAVWGPPGQAPEHGATL